MSHLNLPKRIHNISQNINTGVDWQKSISEIMRCLSFKSEFNHIDAKTLVGYEDYKAPNKIVIIEHDNGMEEIISTK